MYNKIVKNIIYPISDKLLGLSINNNLKKNRSIQWLPKEELSLIQTDKLYSILLHSMNNIPYYKKILKDSNFNLEGELFQELRKIPTLTKKIIKQNLPIGIIYKKRNIYATEKTSGSSGEQGVFFLDR